MANLEEKIKRSFPEMAATQIKKYVGLGLFITPLFLGVSCGDNNNTLPDSGSYSVNDAGFSIDEAASEECLHHYFEDADNDGYGNPNAWVCEPLAGYVGNNMDYDDNNPKVYPDAPEGGEYCEDNYLSPYSCDDGLKLFSCCDDQNCRDSYYSLIKEEERETFRKAVDCFKDHGCHYPSSCDPFEPGCAFANCLEEYYWCLVGSNDGDIGCNYIHACILPREERDSCDFFKKECFENVSLEAKNHYLQFVKCLYTEENKERCIYPEYVISCQ